MHLPADRLGREILGARRVFGCVERTRYHSVLHHEVGAKLWEWPCYYHPDDLNPYPVNSPAARSWDKESVRLESLYLVNLTIQSVLFFLADEMRQLLKSPSD